MNEQRGEVRKIRREIEKMKRCVKKIVGAKERIEWRETTGEMENW